MKKSTKIIISIIIFWIIWFVVYLFIEPIAFYIDWKIKNILSDSNIPSLECESWYEKKVLKPSSTSRIVVCENKNNEWKWEILFSNEKWEITRRWFYNNNKPDWKWESYNNWEVVGYKTYINNILEWDYYFNWEKWQYLSWEKIWKRINASNWKIYEEINYKNWVLDWIYKQYDWTNLIYETPYVDWIISWIGTWYKDWKINKVGPYKWGQKEWQRTIYDEEWNISAVETYVNWLKTKEKTYKTEEGEYNEDERDELSDPTIKNTIIDIWTTANECIQEEIIWGKIELTYDDWKERCENAKSGLKDLDEDDYDLLKTTKNIIDEWLKYIEVSQLMDAAISREGKINKVREDVFDDEYATVNNLQEEYKKLENIIDDLSPTIKSIFGDTETFLYLPEELIDNWAIMVHTYIDEEKTENTRKEFEETWIKDSIDKKIDEIEYSTDKIQIHKDYLKLVTIVEPCIGEKIVAWKESIRYSDRVSQCEIASSKLEEIEVDEGLKWIKHTLEKLVKVWIEKINEDREIWKIFEENKVDLWNWNYGYQMESSDDSEDIVEKIKMNYKKLEKNKENVKREYWFEPKEDFYISKDIVEKNLFRHSASL